MIRATIPDQQSLPKRAALRLDATVSLMSLPGRAHVALAPRWVRYGVRKARLASGPLALAPATVNAVHEARRGARPAEAWLPDPAPVQDPGCFTCVWQDAFAGSLLWHTRGRKGTGH